MRKLLGLLILLSLPMTAFAQLSNTVMIPYGAAPMGGCSFLQLANRTDAQHLYYCDGSTSTWVEVGSAGAGTITGSGTTNTIPKFTAASVIGNSQITDTGSLITLPGNVNLSGVSASQVIQTDASKNLISSNTLPSGTVLVAPVLGTPASGTLTNATGLPITGISGHGGAISTGNHASIGATTLVTPAAQTPYLVAIYLAQDSNVTCTVTYGTVNATITWVDAGGNESGSTVTITFQALASGPAATRLFTNILSNASSNIQYSTTYVAGTGCTGNGSTYTVSVSVLTLPTS